MLSIIGAGADVMKKIIFVRNLCSDEDVVKIKEALEETRVDFSVLLDRKAVVIEGNNDALYAAKVALREIGFMIE